MKQPAINMPKALLRCLIDSRGIRLFRSFTFIHFEADGTYHFSHSASNPVSRKRKILKRVKIITYSQR